MCRASGDAEDLIQLQIINGVDGGHPYGDRAMFGKKSEIVTLLEKKAVV